ncbi:hypothetical protein P8452_41781 [Trifolium repens]|nr:hypothetical protein P8452_41781 [Trifolium repens]
MVEFISKTGNDPFKDLKVFHSFMNDSIDAEINTKQLKRKVRDFKEKFGRGKWKYDDKIDFGLLKKIGRGNNGRNEARKGKVVSEKGHKNDADISLLLNEMFSFANDIIIQKQTNIIITFIHKQTNISIILRTFLGNNFSFSFFSFIPTIISLISASFLGPLSVTTFPFPFSASFPPLFP